MRFDRRTLRATATLAAALLAGGCMQSLPAIDGPLGLKLHTEQYGRAGRDTDTLVIIVNGDGTPDMRASDDAAFARAITQAVPNSAALTLLRPGYADADGDRSPGDRAEENGANLGPEHLQALVEAVSSAQRRFPDAKKIVVGTGGGAALVADMAGLYPKLLDGMVIVGCPCSMPEWRAFRAKQAPGRGWEQKVGALDPLMTAGGVDPDLRAVIAAAEGDETVPPRFVRPYAEALALRGITTDFRILPDQAANSLNDPELLQATARLAAQLKAPR